MTDTFSTEKHALVIGHEIQTIIRTTLPYHELELAQSDAEVMHLLVNRHYDVIVVDWPGDEAQADDVAKRLQDRFSHSTILTLQHGTLTSHDEDKVPVYDEPPVAASPLAAKYQELHRLTEFVYILNSLPNDGDFVFSALEVLCSFWNLYGATVVLVDGTIYRLYSVGTETASNSRHQMRLAPHPHNPFIRTLESGVTQVLRRVSADEYYHSSPVMGQEQAAIFVPLTQGPQTFGAVALFRQTSDSFSNIEITFFQKVAAHLALALNYRAQMAGHRGFRSTDAILETWETFLSINTVQELAQALRHQAMSQDKCEDALIWLYGDGSPITPQLDSQLLTASDSVREVFTELVSQRDMHDILSMINSDARPIVLWMKQLQGKRLARLFDAMNADYIIFVPIMDSMRLLGLMTAGFHDAKSQFQESISQLESLARVAGRAIERLDILSHETQRVHRLETLFQSVDIVCLLVGSDDRVEFASQAFETLLGIPHGALVSGNGIDVVRMVADQSDQPAAAWQTLNDHLNALFAAQSDVEQMTTEILLHGRWLSIELARVDLDDRYSRAWSMVLRSGEPAVGPAPHEQPLINTVLAALPEPHRKLREIATNMMADAATQSTKLRRLLVRSLEREIEKIGLLWQNIALMAESDGAPALDFESIEVFELLNLTLDMPLFRPVNRRFRVNPKPSSMDIRVDTERMTNALANLINHVLEDAQSNSDVRIDYDSKGDEVLLTISADVKRRDAESYLMLFDNEDPEAARAQLPAAKYGLYLAQRVIEQHGGSIRSETTLSEGLRLLVTLPMVNAFPDAEYADPEEARPPQTIQTSAPQRSPQRIALFRGQSQLVRGLQNILELQGYEMISLAPEEANNLTNARVGLIIIDATRASENPFDIFQQVRGIATAPVVFVADTSDAEVRVRALNLGVEDYISGPISQDELSARINVLLQRLRVKDLVREPLTVQNLTIDFAKRQVWLKGAQVDLTRLEYDLLHILATNPHRVLSHEQILTEVWGPEYRNETQYLWVNMRRLRQKIEADPSKPFFIRTQPRTGYYFHTGA